MSLHSRNSSGRIASLRVQKPSKFLSFSCAGRRRKLFRGRNRPAINLPFPDHVGGNPLGSAPLPDAVMLLAAIWRITKEFHSPNIPSATRFPHRLLSFSVSVRPELVDKLLCLFFDCEAGHLVLRLLSLKQRRRQRTRNFLVLRRDVVLRQIKHSHVT